MKKVTLCYTSYSRFDFLKKSLDSFLNINTYPIDRIVIIEDSTKLIMKEKILKEFGDKIELIFNDTNIGQARSIDKMYNTVTTDYIFHTEEDYFYTGNPNFIKDSMDILEERSDLHQVWCRNWNNYAVTHGGTFADQFESSELKTTTDVSYRLIREHYLGWSGFTWNPGLRRTIDYKTMFPNGYAGVVPQEHLYTVVSEGFVNQHSEKHHHRAAVLLNGVCETHDAYNNSTYNKSSIAHR